MNIEKMLNKTVVDMKPSGIRKFFDIVAQMPDRRNDGGRYFFGCW